MTCQASELVSKINLNILKIILSYDIRRKLKIHILGDFFSEGTKKKRENGEGIRYRRKENVFFLKC